MEERQMENKEPDFIDWLSELWSITPGEVEELEKERKMKKKEEKQILLDYRRNEGEGQECDVSSVCSSSAYSAKSGFSLLSSNSKTFDNGNDKLNLSKDAKFLFKVKGATSNYSPSIGSLLKGTRKRNLEEKSNMKTAKNESGSISATNYEDNSLFTTTTDTEQEQGSQIFGSPAVKLPCITPNFIKYECSESTMTSVIEYPVVTFKTIKQEVMDDSESQLSVINEDSMDVEVPAENNVEDEGSERVYIDPLQYNELNDEAIDLYRQYEEDECNTGGISYFTGHRNDNCPICNILIVGPVGQHLKIVHNLKCFKIVEA